MRPSIPTQFSNLMAKTRQETLEKKEAQYRSVSQASCMSVGSTVSEIMENKVAILDAELDYLKTYRNGVIDLHAVDSEIKDELMEDIRASRKRMRSLESELAVLKRQKKIIRDDLDESVPKHETVQDAYASVLCHKVMTASSKQKGKKFDQEQFRNAVSQYYETLRSQDGQRFKWCHVLRKWYQAQDVKAAHLVPKSLAGDELSYLFGVGEAILSDPRNGKWIYLQCD
jgi:hypothetical protein